MKTWSVALACDVGGTSIKLGLVRNAKILSRCEIAANRDESTARALHRIAKSVPALCRDAGISERSLVGFGLSFPGVIEPGTERILSTPAGKFDDAKDIDDARIVERTLGLPVRICNDANAAMAGEWHFGAARGYRSAVMMTLGTGIGASAIIDGIPRRGQHGQAGCLGGHLTANINGGPCGCGNIGCAESEASTWALPEQVKSHSKLFASALAREATLDYAAVFRHAADRDVVAVELRDRSIRVWSAALVSLIHAYDPEVAVIGGGIMRSGTIILPRMKAYVSKYAWTPWGKVRIAAAKLKNDAGLLGVASLFKNPI